MIKIIAASTRHGIIGLTDGTQPWKCQEDLNHFFLEITGKSCIIGRKTYEKIPIKVKNLAELHLISRKYSGELLPISRYIGNFIKKEEWMILGGATIFKQAFKFADQLILTKIHDNCLKEFAFNDSIQIPMFADLFILADKGLIPAQIEEKETCTIYRFEKRYFSKREDIVIGGQNG